MCFASKDYTQKKKVLFDVRSTGIFPNPTNDRLILF